MSNKEKKDDLLSLYGKEPKNVINAFLKVKPRNGGIKKVSEHPKREQLPLAKHKGKLVLGDKEIDCYVLDTEERVISLRAAVTSITKVEGGALEDYLGVKALKSFIDKDLVLEETIEFKQPKLDWITKGIKAENFLDICRAYVNAYVNEKLTTSRQKEIAIQCSILLSACAKVGLIALIDEATGYQYERNQEALRIKLAAYISEELRDWEKTFPDELWEEFGRLTGWSSTRLHSRPKWWGKLVMEVIYDALDPDVAQHLRENKPPPRHKMNYHQWMTSDVGLKALIPHINQIIGIAKTCESLSEFREQVGYHFKKEPLQLRLPSK